MRIEIITKRWLKNFYITINSNNNEFEYQGDIFKVTTYFKNCIFAVNQRTLEKYKFTTL